MNELELTNNGHVLHGTDAHGNRVHRIVWEDQNGNEYCVTKTRYGNMAIPVRDCIKALSSNCYII